MELAGIHTNGQSAREWRMASPRTSEHAYLEAEHAALVQRDLRKALGARDPVPACGCVRCRVLALLDRGEIDAGAPDVLLAIVLPELAAQLPIERHRAAEETAIQWCECTGLELPEAGTLVELAALIPGARRAPQTARALGRSLPVEEARRASIVEVCADLGIDLRRSGQSWRGSCPFHDSQSGKSFTVDSRRRLWYCFSCGIGGDVIDLYLRAHGVGFVDAVRALAS